MDTADTNDRRDFFYGLGRIKVLDVLDGDTVKLEIDLGFGVKFVDHFRIKGIDAPEIKGKTKGAGLIAREELKRILGDGSNVWLTSFKALEKDKYGRWLADPFVNNGPATGDTGYVAEHMIAGGFAVAYNGGKRVG